MPEDQRRVMRQFATGVCIATTFVGNEDERLHDAITVNSVASLSLDPPLIALSFRHESRFLARIRASRCWAVSILSSQHESIALTFAQNQDQRAWAVTSLLGEPGPVTGSLILDGPGWMECELERSIPVGDHTMVVGRVVSTGLGRAEAPLIFLEGKFRTLETIR